MEPRHLDALLIGGGVAAARCARALRRGAFTGSIALVGEEPIPPYNRPPLSKELLRGELPAELVLAEPASWYERRHVELLLGTPATSIDPGERLVELADGRRLRYGHCLLATGALPRRPGFPGAERAALLRTLADSEAIRARALPGRRAVIIGGGFIGVEVSASLAARGMEVTLLCGTGRLWGGAFGATVSEWGASRLAAAGVAVRFNAAVERLDGGTVRVGGEPLEAALVVAGVGVEPRVELAAAAGLAIDDGILVDRRQATSAAGVFAAGDVARPRDGTRVEHWHAAREGGERAAGAILGAAPIPARAPWIFSEFAGGSLDVIGLAERDDDEVEVAPGVLAFVRDGRLRQVASLDGAAPVDGVRELIERGGSAAELVALAGA